MNRIKRNPTKIVNGQVRKNTPYRKDGQAYRLMQKYGEKKQDKTPIKTTNYMPMLNAIDRLNESIDNALIQLMR